MIVMITLSSSAFLLLKLQKGFTDDKNHTKVILNSIQDIYRFRVKPGMTGEIGGDKTK